MVMLIKSSRIAIVFFKAIFFLQISNKNLYYKTQKALTYCIKFAQTIKKLYQDEYQKAYSQFIYDVESVLWLCGFGNGNGLKF